MKLAQLTERRHRSTRIMYHGTSSVNLRSILKNGLLANPPKKNWSGDRPDQNLGLESLGGVYLTSWRLYAENIAEDAVSGLGGAPILLTVRFVESSGEIDEDNVLGNITRAFRKMVAKFNHELAKSVGDDGHPTSEYESFTEWERANRDEVMNDIMDMIEMGFGNDRVEFNKFGWNAIKEIVTLILDYVDEEFLNNHGLVVHHVRGSAPGFDQALSQAMSNGKYRSMRENSKDSVRLTRNVGFRGKTRIIKIESIPNWRDKKAKPEVYYPR